MKAKDKTSQEAEEFVRRALSRFKDLEVDEESIESATRKVIASWRAMARRSRLASGREATCS